MEQGAKRIPLSKGLFAWVSAEDYERVSKYKWHANLCRYKGKSNYYARAWVPVQEDGLSTASLHHKGYPLRHVLLHRFILKLPAGVRCDHEDLDRMNCTRSNLRPATNAQNMSNQMERGNSGFKGVHRAHDGRYQAAIGNGGPPKHLGRFSTAEQAAKVYDDAARARFGKFARLNFPRDGELPARQIKVRRALRKMEAQ